MDKVIVEVTALISAVAALGAVWMSWVNRNKLNALHVDVNSRLSELLTATAHASHAEGLVQGRQDLHDEQGSST